MRTVQRSALCRSRRKLSKFLENRGSQTGVPPFSAFTKVGAHFGAPLPLQSFFGFYTVFGSDRIGSVIRIGLDRIGSVMKVHHFEKALDGLDLEVRQNINRIRNRLHRASLDLTLTGNFIGPPSFFNHRTAASVKLERTSKQTK